MTTRESALALFDAVRLIKIPDADRRSDGTLAEPKVGMTGAIVDVHNNGEAFEVEFVGKDGRPEWLGTLYPHEIELQARHKTREFNARRWLKLPPADRQREFGTLNGSA
jgi:hypothetical protein